MSGWLRGLFRLVYRRKLVGQDLHGNQYFEAEALTPGRRSRRSVKLQEVKSGVQYTQDSIPAEWQRWLRGLRNDPPTLQELQRSSHQRQVMQRRVEEAARMKPKAQQAIQGDPTEVDKGTQATEHAAAPTFKGSSESSEDPTSTGKSFQPASWKPS